MIELVQGMGTALQSVTDLTLKVSHDLIRSSRTKGKYTRSRPPENSPASFAMITRTVCMQLAAALPALQALRVEGCCRDAAFHAFGSSCPLVTLLQVEAITLPIKALKDIHQNFPGLINFTLASPAACESNSQLGMYVGAALQALQACTSLTRLELAFNGNWVECKPGRWTKVPQSIRELVCHGVMGGLEYAPELLGLLHILTIKYSFMLEPLKILGATSERLQHFSIHDPSKAVVVLCYGGGLQQGLSLLRKRVLAGLEFSVPMLTLMGSALQVTIAALPTLPTVCKCKLDFFNLSEPLVLEHVARVFPHLDELCLEADSLWLENAMMGMQVLEPLVGCTFLVKLSLHLKIALSATGLAALFARMPALKLLSCSKSVGVDVPHLQMLLAAQGSVVQVEENSGKCQWDGFF